jgi:hypothetical protein
LDDELEVEEDELVDDELELLEDELEVEEDELVDDELLEDELELEEELGGKEGGWDATVFLIRSSISLILPERVNNWSSSKKSVWVLMSTVPFNNASSRLMILGLSFEV